MKKIMFLALMTIGVFAFTSCDNDDDIMPDQIFNEALKAKYPDATRTEWEKEKTYYVADCWVANKDLEVWFNNSAEWLMTETELTRNDIPAAVITTLEASKYSTWRADDFDMLEYKSSPTRYVIEVEEGNKEFDLYFSVEGELVEERDVSKGDNTHWPE